MEVERARNKQHARGSGTVSAVLMGLATQSLREVLSFSALRKRAV